MGDCSDDEHTIQNDSEPDRSTEKNGLMHDKDCQGKGLMEDNDQQNEPEPADTNIIGTEQEATEPGNHEIAGKGDHGIPDAGLLREAEAADVTQEHQAQQRDDDTAANIEHQVQSANELHGSSDDPVLDSEMQMDCDHPDPESEGAGRSTEQINPEGSLFISDEQPELEASEQMVTDIPSQPENTDPVATHNENGVSDQPVDTAQVEASADKPVDSAQVKANPSEDTGKPNEADERSDDEKKTSTKKARKQGQKRAKTAREYIGNRHAKEVETGKRSGPKRLKTNHSFEDRTEILSSVNDMALSRAEGTLPSMASLSFDSTGMTRKEIMERIMKNAPEGHDNRRSTGQRRDLDEAATIFGYKKVKNETAPDGTLAWTLKGMNCFLKSHQLVAASWMVQSELAREFAQEPPFGGILADVMGLGKTVVSIACAIGNPPDETLEKGYSTATLIVVPNQTTAEQWRGEIQRFGTGKFAAVAIYRGGKDSRRQDYEQCLFVITTYNQVMSQCPPSDLIDELNKKHNGNRKLFDRKFNRKLGDLFMIKWYRIILDEAHAIKNYTSRTAGAANMLIAKYRWALSGTPYHNSRKELFPYLKFLGCDSTGSHDDFVKTYITGPGAKENFDALSSQILFRRTHKDEFLGDKMLDLPDSTVEEIWVPLSIEESILVQSVHDYYERRSRGPVNQDEDPKSASKSTATEGQSNPKPKGESTKKAPEDGGTKDEKNGDAEAARHAYGMRLRLAISHPFGLEAFLRENLRVDDVSALRDELEEQGGKVPILEQLENLTHGEKPKDFLQRYSYGFEKLKKLRTSCSAFGGTFDMKVLLQLVLNERKVRRNPCGLCQGFPKEPIASIACEHIFCTDCLFPVVQRSKLATCKVEGCGKILRMGQDVKTLTSVQEQALRDGRVKDYGLDSNGITLSREMDENGLLYAAMDLNDADLAPSSKLSVAMATILCWQKTHPNDKIIVFTWFVMTGKVLGTMLGKAKMNFLYLFGCMNGLQRNAALHSFKNDPKQNILIASVKVGGQSLNVVEANRVITLDSWWNDTVEQQAYGRVLRRGQTKECHLVRIMAEDTIDNRLQNLQDMKSADISSALQDDREVRAEAADGGRRKKRRVPKE
ncbi:SNF2 family N-terminal domain-containing protein [Stachybotrys elegans]|uniref:SNF2 family N-terminal domain-containing protein n=1 Tax=Stachybotrys elegans TaxID=80388 RepID=A0A8K0T205_9HYPO|nr:SNF2 family N-terminal domain-containing protein [Stachybotrys elegans]